MRRMMHPQHGFHVVSAGDDVELMRRNGWVDDDGRALAAKLAPSAVPEPLSAAPKPSTGWYDKQMARDADPRPAAPRRPRKG